MKRRLARHVCSRVYTALLTAEHAETDEPAKQDIVVDFFHQQPLAADREATARLSETEITTFPSIEISVK